MKTPKKDAKSNKRIIITTADNCKAVRSDHQNCVIAKAIKRQLGAEWVDVGATTVLVRKPGQKKAKRYLLDYVAREQVRYFDSKNKFAPCAIVLHAPPPRTGKRTGHNARSGPGGHVHKSLATR